MSIEEINYELDVGAVRCSCGCGLECTQSVVIKGEVLDLPDKNPMTHYRRYKEQERMREEMRNQMVLGSRR